MKDSLSQQIGEKAERGLEAIRPVSEELTVYLSKPVKDFGIDYFVQYSINHNIQDLSFLIQLKGTGKKLTTLNKAGKSKGLLSFKLENEEYKKFLVSHKSPISLIVVDNLDSDTDHSIYFCSKIEEDDLKVAVYIDPKDKLTKDTNSWLRFIDKVREANLLISQKNIEQEDKINFIRGFKDKIKSQRVELENGYYAVKIDNNSIMKHNTYQGWAIKHPDNKPLKFTVTTSLVESEENDFLKDGILPLDGEFDIKEDIILETGLTISKGSKFTFQSGSIVKLKIKNKLNCQFLMIDSNFLTLSNTNEEKFKYRVKSLPYEAIQIEFISDERCNINFDYNNSFLEDGLYDVFLILNENTEVEIFSFQIDRLSDAMS
jgi:Domain of unknown function (DUF4365)